MKVCSRAHCLLILSLLCTPLFASTWYVRHDGGTRYSTKMPAGQCDGKADAPYPGKGVNRPCAFNDVRYLWMDGSYTGGTEFPGWGWIGAGGDTYLIRGSIATGVSYRIGWNNKSNVYDDPTHQYWGLPGNPYGSYPPPPPSGTADRHTKILGENYASCHAPSAKTQLHGGFALNDVLNMEGASYVDLACLDITDFSACGRASQADACLSDPGSLSDYAQTGISWSNTSTHDTLTDVHIHGLAANGMRGPTGTGMVFSYLDIIANAGAGWNADRGDGSTGTGSLRIENFNISWNGCAEEYPIVDPLPYRQCTDDNGGGYGDGFGTATAASIPAWNVTFDHGTASNNTQDGLDALHVGGAGSSMTVSHTLAYGNMGQQIKVGGASGTITDNQIVTNCNALRQAIPGTPAGFNSKLSDFCRAADAGVVVTVNDQVPLIFVGNTIYSASSAAIEIECASESCSSSAKIDFRRNIFIGFENGSASGYPNHGKGQYSTPIYIGESIKRNPFKNPGSKYANNITYHPGGGWRCPASGESNAVCGDPHLADESWHLYGYGNMAPTAATPNLSHLAPGLATSSTAGLLSYSYKVDCLCAGVLAVAAWSGFRLLNKR